MSCYIVSFQVAQSTTLDKLRVLLKTYKAYCPINATCWAIKTDQKAKDIRDYLKESLESGDRIFVVRSGTEAAWRGAISDKHSEWLKKNL